VTVEEDKLEKFKEIVAKLIREEQGVYGTLSGNLLKILGEIYVKHKSDVRDWLFTLMDEKDQIVSRNAVNLWRGVSRGLGLTKKGHAEQPSLF